MELFRLAEVVQSAGHSAFTPPRLRQGSGIKGTGHHSAGKNLDVIVADKFDMQYDTVAKTAIGRVGKGCGDAASGM